MFCTQCGTQAISTAKYCAKCGTVVDISSSPADTEYQHLKEKYRAAIGQNSDYYIDRFISFKISKSYFSWNWAAFIICIPWTIYRRMYKLAAILIVIFSLWCYQAIRLLEYSKINPNLEEVLVTLFVLAWIAKGTYGIFANALYFYHIDKNKLNSNPTMQKRPPSTTAAQTSFTSANQNGVRVETTPEPPVSITTPTQNISPKPKGFSWKILLSAFFIAVFLNAGISVAAGVEPRKNLTWTVFWIYLTIDGWKYLQWKALLPYPLFIVINTALYIVMANSSEGSFWLFIGLLLVLNIGGLFAFSSYIGNAKRNNIDRNL